MNPASGLSSGKKSYGSYDSTAAEQSLLNDLESSTRNIFLKAKTINREAQEQELLIGSVSEHFDKAHSGLRAETSHIHHTRKEGDQLCWMYSVIAGEVLFIIVLLYIGL